MNAIVPILTIITSLKSGNSLLNQKMWKYIQILINISAISVPVISIFFPQFVLTTEQYTQLATAVAGLNVYFVSATSDKVGL